MVVHLSFYFQMFFIRVMILIIKLTNFISLHDVKIPDVIKTASDKRLFTFHCFNV